MVLLNRNISRFTCEHRFNDLMELYEQNYLRLCRLVPRLGDIQFDAISCIPGHLDLHLQVTEKSRYTTTVKLTYQFLEANQHRLLTPDLCIHIYHDARLAECQNTVLPFMEIERFSMIQRKWYMNRFLYKWLGYCLHQGHCLLPYGHYHKTHIFQYITI